MDYELYYWPGIPGRGEFVRLALEEAGAEYLDLARDSGGEKAAIAKMQALMKDPRAIHPSFAPPFLKAGDLLIGQTANILLFLGRRLGLAPAEEAGRLWAHQLQLTLADWVVEAHDAHHPLGGSFYYDEQKAEARRRSERFLAERLPKFLGYFETVLDRNPAGARHLAGAALSCADLSLFQIVEGLRYAFPRAMAKLEADYPKVLALRDRVAARERIAAYLASERRQSFNEYGLFRHYPELDA